MNRIFTILLPLLTLFSVVMENYKGFFSSSEVIELVEKKDYKDKDSGIGSETEDLDSKVKYFAAYNIPGINIVTINRFYIKHSFLFPAPCTLMMEMPPEQA